MIIEGTCVAVGLTSASAAAITLLGVLRDWRSHPELNGLIVPDERQGRTYWDYDHAKRQALPIHRLAWGERVLLEIPTNGGKLVGEAFVVSVDVESMCDPVFAGQDAGGMCRFIPGPFRWEVRATYQLVPDQEPKLLEVNAERK